ncbi:hypothetical protein [uncultured Desulfovibrio sp.]|uniref:hypothetical protein n=1 Tax=uncultured Desulfovibrio sp. TaxID=167968 RepID=UPI002625CDB0|nr:hypothetical protein [uncultured Desulfovibrio sp.]
MLIVPSTPFRSLRGRPCGRGKVRPESIEEFRAGQNLSINSKLRQVGLVVLGVEALNSNAAAIGKAENQVIATALKGCLIGLKIQMYSGLWFRRNRDTLTGPRGGKGNGGHG